MVIYIDILLALNWWIDFLLLLGVRRATGGGTGSWRLAVGALVGAVSCLVLFLPPMPVWLSLLVRLSAAVLMASTLTSTSTTTRRRSSLVSDMRRFTERVEHDG